MTERTITFNDVPEAMTYLINRINELEDLIEDSLTNRKVEMKWLNIDDLCEYLPDKPAKQTVYGWVCKKKIPYHKKGKKLQFLKSEIDEWLLIDEMEEDPEVILPMRRRTVNY